MGKVIVTAAIVGTDIVGNRISQDLTDSGPMKGGCEDDEKIL